MAVTAWQGRVRFENQGGHAIRVAYSSSVYGWMSCLSSGEFRFGSTGTLVSIQSSLEVTSALTVSGNVDLDSLPTSDPSHDGRLWNDSGTVKISSG